MSTTLPKLVIALTHNCDAWIVGSSADPSVESPRDWDVIVPFNCWGLAAHLIPRDAKCNTFGGWKCDSDGVEVDVWPGDLGWLMQHPKAKYAWHPRSGCRLKKEGS